MEIFGWRVASKKRNPLGSAFGLGSRVEGVGSRVRWVVGHEKRVSGGY